MFNINFSNDFFNNKAYNVQKVEGLEMEKNQNMLRLIKNHKHKIEPKYVCIDSVISYLLNRYDCKDVTLEEKIYCKMMTQNSFQKYKHIKADPVVYKVQKNEKSKCLYSEEVDEAILVYIDRESGYIDALNNELFFELALERGVSH